MMIAKACASKEPVSIACLGAISSTVLKELLCLGMALTVSGRTPIAALELGFRAQHTALSGIPANCCDVSAGCCG